MRIVKKLALSENDARPQQRVPLVQAFDAFRTSHPEARLRRHKTKFVFVLLQSAEIDLDRFPFLARCFSQCVWR